MSSVTKEMFAQKPGHIFSPPTGTAGTRILRWFGYNALP